MSDMSDGKRLDITELFGKDPLQYTDDDLNQVISRFREARKQFNLGQAAAGRTKPLTPKQQQTNSLLDKLGVNLDL